MAGCRPWPQARTCLFPEHQSHRPGFRDQSPSSRGRSSRDELCQRHGRHQQHALHAAFAGRPDRLGQGFLWRHQYNSSRNSCPASTSRRTCATRQITNRSRPLSPRAARSSTWNLPPIRRSRSWTSPGWPRPGTAPAPSSSPTIHLPRRSTRTLWPLAPTL